MLRSYTEPRGSDGLTGTDQLWGFYKAIKETSNSLANKPGAEQYTQFNIPNLSRFGEIGWRNKNMFSVHNDELACSAAAPFRFKAADRGS